MPDIAQAAADLLRALPDNEVKSTLSLARIAVRRAEEVFSNGEGTWVYAPILEPRRVLATLRSTQGEVSATLGNGALLCLCNVPRDPTVNNALHAYLNDEGWIIIIP